MSRPDTQSPASLRFLTAIFEASEDAIIGKAPDGKILTWNAAAERMYGYSQAEAVGRHISIIVPPDKSEELQQITSRVLSGERIGPLETVRVTKLGLRLQVSITLSPVRDSEGQIIGASAIGRDVTIERLMADQLEAAESRWQAIVNSAVDGIIGIDARGRIESFNPAAERLFGYRFSEVQSRNVSMLMPASYASAHDGYLHRYLSTGERHVIGVGREVEGRRKDGTTFPLHLSVGEMSFQGVTKFTGIIRDLTERNALEARLRDESALARLGELASVLAHEVRNPLAAVSGAVQMLVDHARLDEDHLAVAGEIINRLDALNELVSDLLMYARPPQPKLGSVNLAELFDVFVRFFQSDPEWKDITFAAAGHSDPVRADAELLKIVLQNLLLNAAQAMNGRGQIAIQWNQAGSEVSIDIADHGPGIDPRVRETLFTPFVTTKVRGTGLGLPTVVRLVRAHGGAVGVHSSGPAGTTIRLTLPTVAALA